MSPILGILSSQRTTPTAFDSIQTYTLGSTQSSITFSSIPATYKHLQLRITCQASGTFGGSINLSMNGDTTTNYSSHYLGSSTTAAFAGGNTFNSNIAVGIGIQQSGVNGVAIIDILDYTSTNKYKTVRSFSGVDNNSTGGVVALQSGVLFTANGLSAVSSITINPQSASFIANSSFALYGIL